MICNVCKHPVYSIGKEWKCNEGCRCLMLGCVLATPAVVVEIPPLQMSRMRMPCVGCNKHNAILGQSRCRDCKRAHRTFEPEVRTWVDNVERETYSGDAITMPVDWCNCTSLYDWHHRGTLDCIHMRPSTGAVNR
jgi:hypothetical protein